jgi:hypothetical protein
MGRIKGPLLSIDAKGSLGKTITLAPWKGLQTIREYSKPTNRHTPAQTAHRNHITVAANAWVNWYGNQLDKPAYDTLARGTRRAPGGWQMFLTEALSQYALGITPGLGERLEVIGPAGTTWIRIFHRLIDTFAGVPLDRIPLFYRGTTPRSLKPYCTASRSPGSSYYQDTTSASGTIFYVALFWSGQFMSGCHKVTIP